MDNLHIQTNEPEGMDIAAFASAHADSICAEVAKDPENVAQHQRELYDLKFTIVKKTAQSLDYSFKGEEEFIWSLAENLPNFSAEAFYQKRSSLLAIGSAVLLGWLLGGLLSGLLGFIGLGGDILRAIVIFGAIWLEDYLSANPRARGIFLTVLGMGALTRTAGMLVSGALRLGSFGNIRQLVFGSTTKFNIFKRAWLLFGAFFLFVFFAKKIGGLDQTAFRHSLQTQIEQCLRLCLFIFSETEKREEKIRSCEPADEDDFRSKKDCQLADAVLSILDSLPPDKKSFMTKNLASAGIVIPEDSSDNDVFIWDSARDSSLYDTIGLIADGDRCRILRRPYETGGKLVKGHAQKIWGERS